MVETLNLSSLNSKQIHDKFAVKNAYSDFWNNIKFRKGWETPAFTLSETVEALLDKAAEIVVRIRSKLDEKDPSTKIRMLDGSAREHMWTLHEDSLSDPEKFVRDVVHATFKDANGYVEGLTEEMIDNYIQQVNHSKTCQEVDVVPQEIVANIRNSWVQTEKDMKDLFDTDFFLPESSQIYADKEQVALLKNIHKELEKVNSFTQQLVSLKRTRTPQDTGHDMEAEPTLKEPKIEEVTTDTEQLHDTTEPMQQVSSPSQPIVEEIEEQTIEVLAPSETAQQKEGEQKLEQQQNIRPIKETSEQTLVEEEKIEPLSEQSAEPMTEQSPEPQDMQTSETTSNTTIEEVSVTQSSATQQDQDQAQPIVEEVKDQDPPKDPESEKAILKIKVVAEDVDTMKKDIKSIHETADKIESIEQIETMPDGKKTIEQLHKKCLACSEKLLRDLMGLDEIVNTPEARPLRKQQVQAIQQLMEETDAINAKLKVFLNHFKEKELEEESKRKEEEARKREVEEKQKKEQVQQEKEDAKETPHDTKRKELETSKGKNLSDLWKKMKLKPKMEVQETREAYIITSFIPGMNKEDIDMSLGNNRRTITISGLRLPSAEEEKQLEQLVTRKIRSARFIHPDEDKDTLTLKAGAGRYGRFEETYEVPHNVDPDSIEASYERGVLKVVLPKIMSHPRRAPQHHSPQRGYYHPSTFFNDNDFWW